ncbi:amidohydrolase family protein [Microbacterium aurum]
MAQRRVLIRHATLVSMDREVGTVDDVDVLVEDGIIADIGHGISDAGGESIDAAGGILAPGFIDTHRHTWQTQLRALCGDWVLGDYLAGVRYTLSPAYEPDDVYLGNYAGGLEALDSGVTTILDFSHCNNTPDHADAAVRGLRDARIRAVFGYGFFDSSPASPPHFLSHDMRVADFHRVADDLQADRASLVSLGAALTEYGVVPIEATAQEIRAARSRGALVVTHTGCVWSMPSGVSEFAEHGLLDPHQVHVHCNTLDEAEWRALAAHGAKISISPETELNMGMGRPVFAQARQHGLKPTLSADVVSLNSGDLFHQLRLAIAFDRWASTEHVNLAGEDPLAPTVSAYEALEWVTVNAAEALGMEDRIGSVTVGKRADLMIVGGHGRSAHPRIDPAATLVFQTTPADVETVLVDGTVVKHDGRLLEVDETVLDERLDASAARILERVKTAGATLPGTPPGGMFAAIRAMAEAASGSHAPA